MLVLIAEQGNKKEKLVHSSTDQRRLLMCSVCPTRSSRVSQTHLSICSSRIVRYTHIYFVYFSSSLLVHPFFNAGVSIDDGSGARHSSIFICYGCDAIADFNRTASCSCAARVNIIYMSLNSI